MSLDAFISGQSVVTPFGDHVPNTNPVERRRAMENRRTTAAGGSDEDADTSIKLAERTSSLIRSYQDYISDNVDEEMVLDLSSSTTSIGDVRVDWSERSGYSYASSSSSSSSSHRRSRPMLREWNREPSSTAPNANANISPWSREMFDGDHFADDSSSHEEKKYRYTHPIYHSRKLRRTAALCAIILLATVIAVIVVPRGKRDDVDDRGASVSLEAEKKKTEWASLLLEQEEEGEDNFRGNVWLHNPDNDANDDGKRGEDGAPAITEVVIEESTEGEVVVGDDKSGANEASDEDSTSWDTVAGEISNILEPAKPEPSEKPLPSFSTNDASSDNAVESITGNILCCSSSSESTSTSTNAMTDTDGDKASAVARAESYHPVWYNRSGGWSGTTWIEALAFCSSLDQQVDDNVVFGLCPYAAYCPMGPHQMPLGGYRDGEAVGDINQPGDRAPISDFVDGWVQVGSTNPCVEYTISGGLEAVDVTATSPVGGEVDNVHGSTNTFTEVEEDFDVAVGLVKETFVPIVKPGPEYYIENDDHEEESSSSKVELTVNSTYLQLHEQFKPLWLSSKEGWNGGSYADAVAFCNSVRGKQLCPYSVICPNGPGHAVMGGRHALEFKVEGEQYAPILGGDNHWVMVGNINSTDDGGTEDKDSSTSKCMTHRQLEGKNPEWGLNGDKSEVKKHIMCCTFN